VGRRQKAEGIFTYQPSALSPQPFGYIDLMYYTDIQDNRVLRSEQYVNISQYYVNIC
jgi:hypothetical protein